MEKNPAGGRGKEDSGLAKTCGAAAGHADLAGSQKSRSRCAVHYWSGRLRGRRRHEWRQGAFAKLLLREFGTEIASHTIQVGHVRLEKPAQLEKIHAVSADLDSPLRCIDAECRKK